MMMWDELCEEATRDVESFLAGGHERPPEKCGEHNEDVVQKLQIVKAYWVKLNPVKAPNSAECTMMSRSTMLDDL